MCGEVEVDRDDRCERRRKYECLTNGERERERKGER